MSKREKYIELPREIHNKILEKHPMFSYTLQSNQLNWVQFEFDGFRLAVTLDCDNKRHSMKFIVTRPPEDIITD